MTESTIGPHMSASALAVARGVRGAIAELEIPDQYHSGLIGARSAMDCKEYRIALLRAELRSILVGFSEDADLGARTGRFPVRVGLDIEYGSFDEFSEVYRVGSRYAEHRSGDLGTARVRLLALAVNVDVDGADYGGWDVVCSTPRVSTVILDAPSESVLQQMSGCVHQQVQRHAQAIYGSPEAAGSIATWIKRELSGPISAGGA